MLEFFAMGTAVLRQGHVPPAGEPGPVPTLNDPTRPLGSVVRNPIGQRETPPAAG